MSIFIKNDQIDASLAEMKAFAEELAKKRHEAFNRKSGLNLAQCSSGELLDELMKRQGKNIWIFALRGDNWRDVEKMRAIMEKQDEIGEPEDEIRELLYSKYQEPFENL